LPGPSTYRWGADRLLGVQTASCLDARTEKGNFMTRWGNPKSRKKVRDRQLSDLQKAAVDRVMGMISRGAHPKAIIARAEAEAKKIAIGMTPAEKALLRYPDGILLDLDEVPISVVEDHLKRYTNDELKRGQFIVAEGDKKHYVFFMDQKTKERLEKEKAK
jgi:hypothetical protein